MRTVLWSFGCIALVTSLCTGNVHWVLLSIVHCALCVVHTTMCSCLGSLPRAQAAGLLRATSVAHLFSKSRRVEESLPAECRELLGFVEPAEELIRIVTTAVARLEKGALPVVPAAAAPAVAGGDTADRLGAVASSSGGSHGGSMSWQSGGGGWRQPAVAAESDRDGGGGLSATIGGWGLLPSLSARTPAVHVLWRRYHEEWTLYSSEMRYGTQI